MKTTPFMTAAILSLCCGTLYAENGNIQISGANEKKTLTRTVFIEPQRRLAPAEAISVLTYSGRYFRPAPKLVTPEPAAEQIDRVCRSMDQLDKAMDQPLSKDGEVADWHFTREWGAVYANLPRLCGNSSQVSQDTAKYALALLCVKRYKPAEDTALKALEKNKDDYGAVVLLGLLSTRDRKNFSYLEKAFSINPVKSIKIVDWHCKHLDLLDKNPGKWDFIGSYLPLVRQYRGSLKGVKLAPSTAFRLLQAIKERYCDDKYRIRDEYKKDEAEWNELIAYLRSSAFRENQ